LGEEWGCHKPRRELGSLARERGPHNESKKDLELLQEVVPHWVHLEHACEGQSTAPYFAEADAQREVMTILEVLGQETQAGVRALLGALTHWKGFSTWCSITTFMGVGPGRWWRGIFGSHK